MGVIGEEEEEVIDEEIAEEEELVEEEVPQMSAGAQEMAKKFSRESYKENDVTISGLVKDLVGKAINIGKGKKGNNGNGKINKQAPPKPQKPVVPPAAKQEVKSEKKWGKNTQDDNAVKVTTLLRDGVTKLIDEIHNLDNGGSHGHNAIEDVTIDEAIQGIYNSLFSEGVIDVKYEAKKEDDEPAPSKTKKQPAGKGKNIQPKSSVEQGNKAKTNKNWNENDVTIKDAIRGLLSRLFKK